MGCSSTGSAPEDALDASTIEQAVQEQTKAERMKTELITNVSHDIKTPLTSIVNYVDLLQKEDVQSEAAREYIAVLSRSFSSRNGAARVP